MDVEPPQKSGAKDNHLDWQFCLNRLARKKKHPNLFEVIELIKKEQATTTNGTHMLNAVMLVWGSLRLTQ